MVSTWLKLHEANDHGRHASVVKGKCASFAKNIRFHWIVWWTPWWKCFRNVVLVSLFHFIGVHFQICVHKFLVHLCMVYALSSARPLAGIPVPGRAWHLMAACWASSVQWAKHRTAALSWARCRAGQPDIKIWKKQKHQNLHYSNLQLICLPPSKCLDNTNILAITFGTKIYYWRIHKIIMIC